MIITLLSDLGKSSPYIPWFESHVRQELNNIPIIHLSHQLPPFKIIDAVYAWKCTIGKYPENSFHISMYDTILSFPQHLLIKQIGNSYYISIDNGMLTTTFDYSHNTEQKFYASKDVCGNFSDFIQNTIKIIQKISTQGINSHNFIEFIPTVIYQFPQSIVHAHKIDCQILCIDQHDNIITDLTYEMYQTHLEGKKYRIHLHRNDSIDKISENPSYNNKGELMAFFNDFGYLQISMSSKNYKTASLLGFHAYNKDSAINSYISIEILENTN